MPFNSEDQIRRVLQQQEQRDREFRQRLEESRQQQEQRGRESSRRQEEFRRSQEQREGEAKQRQEQRERDFRQEQQRQRNYDQQERFERNRHRDEQVKSKQSLYSAPVYQPGGRSVLSNRRTGAGPILIFLIFIAALVYLWLESSPPAREGQMPVSVSAATARGGLMSGDRPISGAAAQLPTINHHAAPSTSYPPCTKVVTDNCQQQ